MNKITESVKFVVKNSRNVKINSQKIDDFCNSFEYKYVKHWIKELPFDIDSLNQKDKLHFLLIFDSLSFSYWGDPKWKIKYNNEELDGAYAMVCAVAKAFEKGIPILDPKYFANMEESDFSKILEGNIEIPLFKERLDIIRETGKILLDKFDGDFTNLVKKAKGDLQVMLDLLLENFPSFRDTSLYKGEKIYFYKRAQLLIADIYQTFNNGEFGEMTNASVLTACADYKLPLILRKMGIISYSDYLADKIDNKVEIKKDSEEEIELRANTIWAIELIREKIKKAMPNVYSIHINDYIWTLSQKKSKDDKPYHLTRTIFY